MAIVHTNGKPVERVLSQFKKACRGIRREERSHRFFSSKGEQRRKAQKKSRGRNKHYEYSHDAWVDAIIEQERLAAPSAPRRHRYAPKFRHSTRTQALAWSEQSQGALIVIKFNSEIPRFAILKDFEKPEIGFAYGGLHDPVNKIVDADIFAAAQREVREEVFSGMSVDISIGKDNLLDVIAEPDKATGSDYFCSIFFIELPDIAINEEGSQEQEWVRKATAEEIDLLIEQGKFLHKHTVAWRMVKNFGLHRPTIGAAA